MFFRHCKSNKIVACKLVGMIISLWTQAAFICSKLTIETLEQDVNMFKVNKKDTTLFLTLNIFHNLFGVSIVNFKQVNIDWGRLSQAKILRSFYKRRCGGFL